MALSSSSSSGSTPVYGKAIAASTGATMTALTMTPFDVIKTRLQTQQPMNSSTIKTTPLFPNTCCQPLPSNMSCVRNLSSYAGSAQRKHMPRSVLPQARGIAVSASEGNVVCLWDGAWKMERCNGFWDAGIKVWRTEGVRGLWKGVGTTLLIAVPSGTAYMLTYDTFLHSFPQHTLTPLISGVVARTLISTMTSPLELLRTRLQATPTSSSQPHTLMSTINGIRLMVRADGLTSLYRGLGSTLWRDVPFSGIYWIGYETIKNKLHDYGYKKGSRVAFASGAISGSLAALIVSPFDTLKTRRQALVMTKDAKNANSFALIAKIMREEGFRALFVGLTPRLAKIAPACGIMISCYEGIGRLLTENELH